MLLYQLQFFSLGRPLPDQPPIHPTIDVTENSRAITAGVDIIGPKPSSELSLGMFSVLHLMYLNLLLLIFIKDSSLYAHKNAYSNICIRTYTH